MPAAPSFTSFHNPATLPPPVGYSHVVQSRGGSLVHVSGQAARNADGALVGEGDFTTQLQQCFLNIQHALEAVGASMADLVKLNYFCDERVPPVALRSVVLVRDRFVNTARPPASSFVVVKRLVRPEWLIEIEAVAHVAALEGGEA